MPIGELTEPLYLAQDGGFGTGDDLLALMGGDGTERTAAKTATVHADGPFDHVVCRDALVLVFGMRRVLIRQVVYGVELLGCDGRIRGVDNDILLPYPLDEGRLMDLIRLDLNKAEVLRMLALVLQGLFVGGEHDRVGRNLALIGG